MMWLRRMLARVLGFLTERPAEKTLLIIAIYTFVAFLQWKELRRTVETSERTLDMTQRAWVFPEIQGPVPKPDGGWVINVLLRNVGRSPAFVEFAATSSLEPKVPTIDGYESGIVIGGGEAENPNLPHIIQLPHPTKSESADVVSGARTLYVWVFIRYKDPIKDGRFTQLCAIYYPQYRRTGRCASQYQIFR